MLGSSFILPTLYFILHPSPFILPPSYFILSSYSFLMIVIDAYKTSSLFNQIIVWAIVACCIFAVAIIWTKVRQINAVLSRNRRFLSSYKRSVHPASLSVENREKFLPGTPFEYIYKSCMKQLLGILHKRGFSDNDIIHQQPDPGTVSATISESEMRSIEACVNSELAEQTLKIEEQMSILGSITNCSTSLGLFGTVYGVMEAFMEMNTGGSAMISKVAPGISGALLTTVAGLTVSIVGTVFYNRLADRIKMVTVKTENFADELIADIAKKYKMS